MRRLSQDVWVVLGLLLLLVAIALLTAGRGGRSAAIELVPRRTSYSPRPSGLKALYDTLREMGYPVRRQIGPLTEAPADGILFLISPMKAVEEKEWPALQRWVERGNLLVVASDTEMLAPDERQHARATSRPVVPSFLSSGVRAFAVAQRERIEPGPAGVAAGSVPHGPKARQPEGDDEEGQALVQLALRFSPPRPMLPLFADGKGTTVAFGRWGRGGVVQLCGGWPLCNEGIASGDNLALVLNLRRYRAGAGGGTVTFDEYHHGYGVERGIWSLLGTPARLGLGQLGLAFLLLLFAVSRRFGRALSLEEGARQRGEYLTSMASLLRKAHALDLAHAELGRRFIQDVASALGLPPTAGPEAIAEAANRRRPERSAELAHLVAQAASPPGAKEDEAELLALAARWHSMRKEMTR